MRALAWDAGLGRVGSGSVTIDATKITISSRPALGFDFESIWYDDTTPAAGTDNKIKAIGDQKYTLTTEEVAACVVFIDTFDTAAGGISDSSLVWGVNETGMGLGLVPKGTPYAVTAGPQPLPSSRYQYDFAKLAWIDLMPLPATIVDLVMRVTLGTDGTATATFAAPFDVEPLVFLTPVNPMGHPVLCELLSYVMTDGKCVGCVVKGHRSQPLPADSASFPNFDPFGGDASGVVVVLHAIKAPA